MMLTRWLDRSGGAGLNRRRCRLASPWRQRRALRNGVEAAEQRFSRRSNARWALFQVGGGTPAICGCAPVGELVDEAEAPLGFGTDQQAVCISTPESSTTVAVEVPLGVAL